MHVSYMPEMSNIICMFIQNALILKEQLRLKKYVLKGACQDWFLKVGGQNLNKKESTIPFSFFVIGLY